MEQTRKHFKITSIIILVLAGASLLSLAAGLLAEELNSVDGVSADILLITKIVLLSVSLVMLLPQIYIGIKGLLIAKNPGTSKGHIIWAMILLVFAITGLIDPIIAMVNKESMYENVSAIFYIVVEMSVYYDYIKYGRALLKETEQK